MNFKLENNNLKSKTINNHINNIDFYINDFLPFYEFIPAEQGAVKIGDFLGDFFIRKTSWASEYTIKENIASLKKFYLYLNEIGKTSDEDLFEMNEIIKGDKEYWIDEVTKYWDDAFDEY